MIVVIGESLMQTVRVKAGDLVYPLNLWRPSELLYTYLSFPLLVYLNDILEKKDWYRERVTDVWNITACLIDSWPFRFRSS